MIAILLAIIIIAGVAAFSVQNAVPVEVSFLYWKFKASLAVVIFLSLLIGVLLTMIIQFSGYIQRSVKKLNKKLPKEEHNFKESSE
jgi:uncharacterized integral membrane protein